VDAIQVLGSLTWELRKLLELKQQQGQISEALYKKHRIWGKRKSLVTQALRRLPLNRLEQLLQLCAQADRAVKGMDNSDPWQLLSQLSLELAGVTVSHHSKTT
jgi:DNA polymerase-3 subunit delta